MASEEATPRITLLQFGTHPMFSPLPTFDPHCLVAQTYLKLAGVPFTVNNCNNPDASPTNKLPVLAVNEVTTVVNTDIFDKLSQMGYNLNAHLDEAQLAEIEAWGSMIQYRLHHAQLYNWYMEKNNYDEVTHLVFAKALPFPLNWLLPRRLKSGVSAQLGAAGFMEARVAYEEANKCYKAISTKLGHHKFIYGEEPTSLDAIVFGFLATQLIPEFPERSLHNLISQYDNLVQYINRILVTYFNAVNPVHVDLEPAQRWLKAQQEEKAREQRTLAENQLQQKDTGSAWAIALGIGAAVLFITSQNVQFTLLSSWLQMRFGDRRKSSTDSSRKYTKEEEEERAKWFGSSALSENNPTEASHHSIHHSYPIQIIDEDENPMKKVHSFAPEDDHVVFIGDDGNAYDWDEQYLEEMQTGSDIPEDHEDLGDEDEEDNYD